MIHELKIDTTAASDWAPHDADRGPRQLQPRHSHDSTGAFRHRSPKPSASQTIAIGADGPRSRVESAVVVRRSLNAAIGSPVN
jgi:hypothetical protein